jgi:hypothetical protein
MMNIFNREPVTDLVAYVAMLKCFGFRPSPEPLSKLLYYSNLPANTYMVDQTDGLVYVHISASERTDLCSWMRFRNGKFDGYGSNP